MPNPGDLNDFASMLQLILQFFAAIIGTLFTLT